MKGFFLCLLVFVSATSYSQKVQLIVKSMDASKPIPKATISHKKKVIGMANDKGQAFIPLEYKVVIVQSLGYEPKEVVLGGEKQTVYLFRKDNKLTKVVVKPKEDAHANRLVSQMIRKWDENHPNELPSYKFYSYSKFIADLDDGLDSATKLKSVKDSTNDKELDEFIQHSKIFVWERLTEFRHHSSYGQKKILLNSRMSGFKEPIYEVLALAMDRVNEIPTMFEDKNYKEYYFRLKDSSNRNQGKTYTIEFFPKKKYRTKRSRNGILKLDSATSAMIYYKGTTKKGFYEIKSNLIQGKSFVRSMFVNMTSSNIQINNYNSSITYSLKTERIETPYSHKKIDFSGYDNEISPSLNSKESKNLLVDIKGVDTLDARESNTYNTMDSIVRKEGLNTKLRLLLALRRGSLKLGKVNLSIFDLLQYNKYEGLRINLIGETNYKFHTKLSFYGLIGYGFGDKAFKYGGGVSYRLNYQNQSKLALNYLNDVFPSGRTYSDLNTRMERFNQFVNVWFIDRFFQSESLKISYQSDIHKYIEQKIYAQFESRTAKFPYFLNSKPYDGVQSMNLGMDLNFYPKTEYLVSPEGKFKVEDKPTKILLSYIFIQPIENTFSNFHRINLEGSSSLKSKLGKTKFSLIGGATFGEIPLGSLFEGQGSSSRNMNLVTTYGLGSYRYFETMLPITYYSDKHIGFFLRHSLPDIRINSKKKLYFSLIYKGLWGEMSSENNHSIAFIVPRKVYQETGLEWDNVIGNIPIGLGFYYRIGAYHQGNFGDNFAARIIFNL